MTTLALLLCAPISLQAQRDSSIIRRPPPGKALPTLQPRQFPAIAHDSVHNQFLLFGGTYGSERFDDTWLLTSSGWRVEAPQTHPAARISSAVAYDSIHGQYVLFGGRVQEAAPASCSPGATPAHLKTEYFCADTWLYNGENWIKKTLSMSPSPREGHAMAFDAAHKQIVLFGGSSGSSSTPFNDTWIWNGTDWKRANPAHSPPARLWHSMAYDPVHREIVLFGGDAGSEFLNDTWLWNGTDWRQAVPQSTRPSLRSNAGLDYNSATRSMLLVSGSDWNAKRVGSPALDTWSWSGTQWKKLANSSFHLITDFSQLTPTQAAAATLANGTPSILWLPGTLK